MVGKVDLRAVCEMDLDLICRHRSEMFREAGREEAKIREMEGPFRDWLAMRLADGRYFGFIACKSGTTIGGVGLMEMTWPPHPLHPTQDRRGYVMNVYVEKKDRGQGIAQSLMRASEAEFARRGVSFAVLHYSDAGKRLYEGMGWGRTKEMAKLLMPSGA